MLNDALAHRVSQHSAQQLKRIRKVITPQIKNQIIIDGKACIDFASNDYLGLKMHPRLTEALCEGAINYGIGSGASPLISGYTKTHQEVEEAFAKWLGVDKALLFSSGYAANTSIIRALSRRSDTIFSDKLCHASLLDGILLSGAKHHRYRHNDLGHLNQLAARKKPNFIVTEGVFSMEGHLSPIKQLVNTAKYYGSELIIDDAHGIGVMGHTGKGVIDNASLTQYDFGCLVAPLGKAFSLMGAIVAGRSEIIECILQFAKSYTYSTAISPALCTAIKAALDVIQHERWRHTQLNENIQWFIEQAAKLELNLINTSQTPIKPILVGSCEKLMYLQHYLLSKGFYVAAIRPPSVPQNKARLRLSLSALHTKEQITQLVYFIRKGLEQC